MARSVKVDAVSSFVRSLDGEYFTTREAAEAVGISPHVLRRCIANSTVGMAPSHAAMIGKMKIFLYTPEDVERVKNTLEERKQILSYESVKEVRGRGGRPMLYTVEERKARARLYSRACYWKNRRTYAKRVKDEKLLAKSEFKLNEIQTKINKGIKGK